MNRSGALILCYHRVAEGVDDPFRLCVSPDNFAAQLEELGRVGEPSTLDDVRKPSRKRRVVVTFDDGYGDNLWNAEPIARAKGVPITVYVTSSKIDDGRGMWWDQLGALLRHRPAGTAEVRLSLPSGPVVVPLGSDGDQPALQDIRGHLLPLSVAEIEEVLADVGRQWSVPSVAPEDARMLTSTEFDDLAAAEVVTIGAHTADHLRLRGQPGEAQRRSVATSKEALEARAGRPVRHFAYPYGGHDAFDDVSVDAVRQAGFATACTTVPGSAGASADLLRLPRRIAADWGRARFRIQMLRWALW